MKQKKIYLHDKQAPFSSQCWECKHSIDLYGVGYCKAFPHGEGIPEKVLYNDIVHSEVIDGQIGDFIFTSV